MKLILIIYFCCFSFLYSKDKSSDYDLLQRDIENLLANEKLNNAHIGVDIFSIDKDKTIYSLNEYKNFVPASTIKLLTTGAALHYLGSDFVYSNQVYLDGNIKDNGEFIGNIIIRGSGDPTLSLDYYDNEKVIFDKIVSKLDSLGIKSIKGNIIGDDNYFDDEYYPSGWAWDDMKYSYSSQVGALNIYDNSIQVNITSSEKRNETANLNLIPNSDFVRIVNNVIASSESEYNEISFERDPITNFFEFFGTIPFDPLRRDTVKEEIAVDNPTLYYLSNFSDHLRHFNIRFKGALIDIDDWNETPVYFKIKDKITKLSPPLADILEVVNRKSNNLTAEVILKTIGKEAAGDGSFDSGVRLVEKFIQKFYERTDFNIVDGSGLSRLNFISPEVITQLLKYMYNTDDRAIFINSLAQPGQEGTLKRRMKNTTAQNRIFAKTGSMNGVSNIAAYIISERGETFIASLFFNNFTMTQAEINNLQDLIIMRLASH